MTDYNNKMNTRFVLVRYIVEWKCMENPDSDTNSESAAALALGKYSTN